ncbi:MAG: redox-sensing transcriptional repressor Rex [Planctomycetota bacterium]
MPKFDDIPLPAVRRLSLYLRELEAFANAECRTVSSRQLGKALGLSDAQVRKDLAYFGQFGHSGIGYRVPELIQRVRRILGTDKTTNALIVGVGNLGQALLSFRGFQRRGFAVVAAFDSDPAKIGMKGPGPTAPRVHPLSEMPTAVRKHNIRLGILTVPASAAQTVADDMVRAGIRAILNFAPVTLKAGRGIAVASVDLGVHLEQLSFLLRAGSRTG